MRSFAPLPAWQVLTDTSLISQRWLEVSEQRVRLANGHEIERFHLIRGPHWAGVVCLTENAQVVLVRQYRHGLGGPSLELPAGVIDGAESPLEAARRELREESGFEAPEFRPLFSASPEPARNTSRAHFFVARGAFRAAEPSLDHAEELEVVLVPVGELLDWVDQGQLAHAAHIGAILAAWRRGWLTEAR